MYLTSKFCASVPSFYSFLHIAFLHLKSLFAISQQDSFPSPVIFSPYPIHSSHPFNLCLISCQTSFFQVFLPLNYAISAWNFLPITFKMTQSYSLFSHFSCPLIILKLSYQSYLHLPITHSPITVKVCVPATIKCDSMHCQISKLYAVR